MSEDDELLYITEQYQTIFEDIKTFEELISCLPTAVGSEIRATFGKIIGGITQCHKDLANMAKTKIESMNSDLNYLVFDLEATRRERDVYKRKLGQ